eukprot:9101193-Alexandrium_andersonii.AAC.1
MSASLVGSEMCIRDRSINPRGHATPTPFVQRTLAHAQHGLRATRASAVSYTHLTLPTICSV